MDVREKLVELLRETGMVENKNRCNIIADELIANGVTILDCKRDCANFWKTKMVTPMWISVKDRLPEEPLQTVLVTNGKETCVAVYSVVYDEFGVMCGRGRGSDKRFGVTHWMPLPQPPKGELG